MRKVICTLFGCNIIEEVYAIERLKKNGKRYSIVQNFHCNRCKQNHQREIAKNLSRAELLKREWFINK